jgi:hypothetical protein
MTTPWAPRHLKGMTCCCPSHDATECAWIRDGRPSAKQWVAEPCECSCHGPEIDDDEPEERELPEWSGPWDGDDGGRFIPKA